MQLNLSEQEYKDLMLIRDYFLTNDKTQFEHFSYTVLNNLIKKLDTTCTCIAFHKTDECYKLGCKQYRINKED